VRATWSSIHGRTCSRSARVADPAAKGVTRWEAHKRPSYRFKNTRIGSNSAPRCRSSWGFARRESRSRPTRDYCTIENGRSATTVPLSFTWQA